MNKDQFKFLIIMLGIIIGLLIAINFTIVQTARGEEFKPFVWMYNNGDGLAVYQPGMTIVEDTDEPIEVDIVEDDVLEHALERELLRQEERRYEWMQDDYRDFLRECGVQEGLMRGW